MADGVVWASRLAYWLGVGVAVADAQDNAIAMAGTWAVMRYLWA